MRIGVPVLHFLLEKIKNLTQEIDQEMDLLEGDNQAA